MPRAGGLIGFVLDPVAAPRPDGSRPVWIGGAAIVALILLWALRDLLVLIGFSVLLAYALDPIVTALGPHRPGGRGLPRAWASAVVMLVVVMVAGVGLSWIVPRAAAELVRLVEGTPAMAGEMLARLRDWANLNGLGRYVDPVTEMLHANLASLGPNAAGLVASGLGRVFGGLGSLLGLAVLPLLSFYLLAEREDVKRSAIRFVPVSYRPRLDRLTGAIDRALRSYVRGQAIVCLVMGVMVGMALALLRFPFALILGILVGLAEVVPYLGFLTAAVAIVLTGFTIDPLHGLLGLGAYALVNNLVGVLVTPRVMGRYLQMHPFVVTVSVLAGARLLGPAGVMLALPLAAVAQSLVSELAPHDDESGVAD